MGTLDNGADTVMLTEGCGRVPRPEEEPGCARIGEDAGAAGSTCGGSHEDRVQAVEEFGEQLAAFLSAKEHIS
jgi:hypothetical protein